MGLLFHTAPDTRPDSAGWGNDVALVEARAAAMRMAIDAHLLGRIAPARHLFTHDVVCRAPHTTLTSLDDLVQECGTALEALSDVRLTFRSMHIAADSACTEWQLSAIFSAPLLLEDDVLIEPTGGPVQLNGATFAEFRDDRICGMRHYFDDSELLATVPAETRYRRWIRPDVPPAGHLR